jgi:SPP1 family predicted phage head-tail adaptor
MEAGKLNKRITIEQFIEKRNELGQKVVKEWQPLITVWANIRNVSGSEFVRNSVEIGEVNTSIRIRKRKLDLNSKMRVIYQSQSYEVVAVLPDEVGNEYVDFACKKGVGDGR